MPTYIHRTLEEFPQSFYVSPANPEGKPYSCPICMDFFYAKSGYISHIKKCCEEEEGQDYSEDVKLLEGYTLGNAITNKDVQIKLTRHYITTNALEQYHTQTPAEIKQIISNELVARGHGTTYELRQWTFQIYRYFFETTAEECDIEREVWVKRISELMGL